MTFKSWFKLIVTILFLAIGCSGLLLYENNNIATVGASSANIILPSYDVGSEYSGLITKQFVGLGDSVNVGQKLFEIKSDQLSAEIAAGDLQAQNLTYKLASDGGFIIPAEQNGVISQLNSLNGSFVSAGTPLAVITGTTGASVRADFDLSGPQYNKVSAATPMDVDLGGVNYRTTINGITQQSVNGHTMTVITANVPEISKSQTIYASGTAVSAKLVLNSHTLYQHLVATIRSQKLIRL